MKSEANLDPLYRAGLTRSSIAPRGATTLPGDTRRSLWLTLGLLAVILVGAMMLHGCGPAPSDCTPDSSPRCEAAR